MLDATERKAYGNAFMTLLPCRGNGPRVGVKDIIDVEGVVSTAGCEYVAAHGSPASADATCIEGVRAAGADIVGKTNLHELAFGTTGINSWSGTPINPLGSDLLPGGSSSGNAVALGLGLCDIALGTDTGGSVRIPSACCGTAGLKTTFGRIPVRGVRPLAASLDIVGPMARDVAMLELGMQLLEPGFMVSALPAERVGRLGVTAADPRVDAAVDQALATAGLHVTECDISEEEWEAAVAALNDVLWAEAATSNLSLRAHWGRLQIGETLNTALALHSDVARMAAAYEVKRTWAARLSQAVADHGLLASPTIETLTPSFQEYQSRRIRLSRFTSPVNLAGLPAVVIPVPSTGGLPASLQLIGPPDSEDLLLATAGVIEHSLTHSHLSGKP